MSLGGRLKAIREALGLSQAEFAETAITNQAHISKVEKGRGNLDEESYQKLSKRYNINLNYLFLGEGAMFLHSDLEQQERWELTIYQFGIEKSKIDLDSSDGIETKLRRI